MSESTTASVNTAATTTPAIDLAVAASLATGSQVVQDQTGAVSALALSSEAVTIRKAGTGTTPGPHLLNVIAPAAIGTSPAMLVRGEGPEASIRYHAGINAVWHVGTLEDGRFFFWSGQPTEQQTVTGFVMTIDSATKTVSVANLAIEKDLNVKGLNAAGNVTLNGQAIAIRQMRPSTEHRSPGQLEQVMIDPQTGELFFQ